MEKQIAQQTVKDVFGKISPPKEIEPLTKGGGAAGISTFLSNAVQLIYIVGSIIFVFMILFSAIQWMLSAGDKEKVANARNRLTYAIIGITLLALSFVIIKLVGQITGFTFFAGQNDNSVRYQIETKCDPKTDPTCN